MSIPAIAGQRGFLPAKGGLAIAFTAASGSTAVALPTGARLITLLADQAFYWKLGASNVAVTASAGGFDGRWLANVPLDLVASATELYIAVLRVAADGTLIVMNRG